MAFEPVRLGAGWAEKRRATLDSVTKLVRIATLALAASMLASGSASSRVTVLTPAEQTWVKKLIPVFNAQNTGLQVVIQQALAKNALVAGEKPANLNLTNTLAQLLNCKVPADLVTRAGKAPTPRVAPFGSALNAACIHDLNGARDFAKAIGAAGKGNAKLAVSLLTTGGAEFKKGSAQLTKAYKSLLAVGGKAIFKA